MTLPSMFCPKVDLVWQKEFCDHSGIKRVRHIKDNTYLMMLADSEITFILIDVESMEIIKQIKASPDE